MENSKTTRLVVNFFVGNAWYLKAVYCASMPHICRWAVGKPARLIIRLLFGFASDSVFDKLNQSTNTVWSNILSYDGCKLSALFPFLFFWNAVQYIAFSFVSFAIDDEMVLISPMKRIAGSHRKWCGRLVQRRWWSWRVSGCHPCEDPETGGGGWPDISFMIHAHSWSSF